MAKNFTTVYFTDLEIETLRELTVSKDKKHSEEWVKTFDSGSVRGGYKFIDEQVSAIVKLASKLPESSDLLDAQEMSSLKEKIEQLSLMQSIQVG